MSDSSLNRPGGAVASRPLHFFWVVDVSGSMMGEKIGAVNYAIPNCLPDMKEAAAQNVNAKLLVRTLTFSSGASWVTPQATEVSDFVWQDVVAGGITDLGTALEKVAEQLTIPPMPERALPPVIVLLSDGQPTDNYKKGLEKLKALPWGRKAVRIAISIGQDADDEVLKEFTGNVEYVLKANNQKDLVKMIKWASTAASLVSQPKSSSDSDASAADDPHAAVPPPPADLDDEPIVLPDGFTGVF